MNSFKNVSGTPPVGPFRCFAISNSANPLFSARSSSSSA